MFPDATKESPSQPTSGRTVLLPPRKVEKSTAFSAASFPTTPFNASARRLLQTNIPSATSFSPLNVPYPASVQLACRSLRQAPPRWPSQYAQRCPPQRRYVSSDLFFVSLAFTAEQLWFYEHLNHTLTTCRPLRTPPPTTRPSPAAPRPRASLASVKVRCSSVRHRHRSKGMKLTVFSNRGP